MSDVDCTPGREPRSVAASWLVLLLLHGMHKPVFIHLLPELFRTSRTRAAHARAVGRRACKQARAELIDQAMMNW